MGFRSRLLVAFGLVVAAPLVVLALGIRSEMRERLTAQYANQVEALVSVIEEDLALESEAIADRLSSLRTALLRDNELRRALLRDQRLRSVASPSQAVALPMPAMVPAAVEQDDPGAEAGALEAGRQYLLDYASQAMGLTGLDMLQIQDERGRILSSGHFRNAFDTEVPELSRSLEASAGGLALVEARTAEGSFLALARAESFGLGGEVLSLVGGIEVGRSFLVRLARDQELAISLTYPGGVLSSGVRPTEPQAGEEPTARDAPLDTRLLDLVFAELPVPFVQAGRLEPAEARFRVAHPLTPLVALRESVDRWLLVSAGTVGLGALLLVAWLTSRLSRPLTDLATKTAQLDLDRLDVEFESRRRDEIGSLSRLLGELTHRLRSSVTKLREAERRATIGELSRQINHDVKNGLTPIRNVFRHLSEVARQEPRELAEIFAQRQSTLDSSIAYLETLAGHYARLSPQPVRKPCDVNALVEQAVRALRSTTSVQLDLDLDPHLPAIASDVVSLRRILENLLTNAVESMESEPGVVTVSTEAAGRDDGSPVVRLKVADSGRGMSQGESTKVFQDFYTTKEGGTGLGLSIVRRLVLDLGGRVEVASRLGHGTCFTVELPAARLVAEREPSRVWRLRR